VKVPEENHVLVDVGEVTGVQELQNKNIGIGKSVGDGSNVYLVAGRPSRNLRYLDI
jgi:hypothetical protein